MPSTRRDFLKTSAAASLALSAPVVHAAKVGKKYRSNAHEITSPVFCPLTLPSPQWGRAVSKSWTQKTCIPFPRAGGSDAVAAGEGFSRRTEPNHPAQLNNPLRA